MASFYKRADIYELFEDENRYYGYKQNWNKLINNKNINTMSNFNNVDWTALLHKKSRMLLFNIINMNF